MKCKHCIILIFLLCVFHFHGFSQDIIMLKTGDEIQSKVVEVGIDIIKYNRFDNLTGPIYTVEKSKVFMIKYQNGSKDIFTEQNKITTEEPKSIVPNAPPTQTEITKPVESNLLSLESNNEIFLNYKKLKPRQVSQLMSAYPEIQKEYKTGRTYNTIAKCIMVPLFASEALAIVQILNNKVDHISDMPIINRKYGPTLIVMGGCFVSYVVVATIGNTKVMKSVNNYNNKIAPSTSFQFYLSPYSLGVAMKF